MDYSSKIAQYELYGDPFLIETEVKLLEQREWITSQRNFYSEGRNLVVLHTERLSFSEIHDLVDTFNRVLVVFNDKEAGLHFSSQLNQSKYTLYDNLKYLRFDLDHENIIDYFLHHETILNANELFLEVVDQQTSRETVKELQDLQAQFNLTPLPGYFIRQKDFDVYTIILREKRTRRIIGGTSLQYLLNYKNVDNPREGKGLSTFVSPEYRNKDLAKVLNAKVGEFALKELKIKDLHTLVYSSNISSMRMCKGLGLRSSEERVDLFITNFEREKELRELKRSNEPMSAGS
jgi:RimJ/RimL family protein N-acetyltransferase